MRRIRSCKAGRSSLEPRQRDQDHVGRWRRGPKTINRSKTQRRPVGKRRLKLKAVAVAHSEPPGVARTRTGGRTEKQAEQQVSQARQRER